MDERLPLEQMVHGRIYAIRSRNLLVGVWDAEASGFIGLRTKFGSEYLFTEYHWDTGGQHGTAFAKRDLGLDVGDIPVSDRGQPRTVCEVHDREAAYVQTSAPDEPRKGYWVHADDNSRLEDKDWPHATSNTALFDLLKPLHDAELRRQHAEWQEEKEK